MEKYEDDFHYLFMIAGFLIHIFLLIKKKKISAAEDLFRNKMKKALKNKYKYHNIIWK